MLDVSLLGTGGMMPLPNRYLTSCLLRYNGSNVLIDCGEGTQTALRRRGWSCKPIDTILLTHFHADHIAGLPGLLLTMGNAEREEPVTIIGPHGIDRIVQAVRTIAPELPFETRTEEIESPGQTFSRCGMEMTAFREKHGIVCYGWEIHIPRQGKFNVEAARARNIPLKYWNPLQKGETVIGEDGNVYTPDMVLGGERPGIKFVYATDTRPVPAIASHARDADLLICEGMYGEDGMEAKAREHKHMTMQEAAEIAREAQPREMWLTHFSPSVVHPEEYLDRIREIFPRTVIPKDGRTISIAFREEEE